MTDTLIILLAVVIAIAVANALFGWLARRRHPPIGRFLTCGGVRLHYIDRGDPAAPVLVLLHGNGAMLQDFLISGVVDLAVPRHRVLCFDRPGFGHSSRPRTQLWTPEAQADLFATALKQLGVEHAIVIGHSWGAMVALALANRAPERVRGLIVAAGYYFPTWRTDVWLLSGPAVPLLGDAMRYTVAPLAAWFLLPKLLAKLFAPQPVAPKFLKEFPRALALTPGQLRAAAEESALMIPAAARLAAHYRALACPVAVFAGRHDEVVEPEQARRLQQILPRAIMRNISDAGHMVHYAAPERIMDAVALIKAWPPVAPALSPEKSRAAAS